MSLTVILYKGKSRKDGTHPVMLQALQGKEIKRFPLGLFCHPKDWDAKERKFLKTYPDYKEANKILRTRFKEAEDLWDDLMENNYVDWTAFLKRFKREEVKEVTGVLDMFDEIIAEMREKGKIGNMKRYKQVRVSVAKYRGNVPFEQINHKYLKGYEVFMFKQGAKEGGACFNMRTFRAVYNRAMMQDVVDMKHYPFYSQLNRRGYSFAHLKSSYKPRPLSETDIEKIKAFPFEEHPKLRPTVDLFLFSYYCNGMSFVDMYFLQKSDIQEGRIHYVRRKTKKPMPSIKVTPELSEIMERIGGKKYVFFLAEQKENLNAEQRHQHYLFHYTKYNRKLKLVAEILGITINVSSYSSRHSFGNILKQKGYSIGKISELYGHTDIQTTNHYLAQFGDENLDDANDLL